MFLAAGLLVPLLLVLYLLKLRRRPMKVSSTFLWLESVRDLQVNIPIAPLRGGLLLLLHVLLIACLILALGRPAIDMPATGQRVLILVDRSASMGAVVSTGGAGVPVAGGPSVRTRLDLARERASEAAATMLDNGARVAIGEWAGEAGMRSVFTTDRNIVTDAVGGITATDQPADFGSVRLLLSGIGAPATDVNVGADAGSGEAAAERAALPLIVVLVTDNPEPMAVDAKGAEAAAIPANVQVRIISVNEVENRGPGEAINVGITQISARRDPSDMSSVRVFLRIRSAQGLPAIVPVRVTLDGEAVSGGDLVVQVTGQPAEGTAILAVTAPNGGTIVATLGKSDALEADNSAAVVVPAKPEPRIVLVAPNPGQSAADPVLLALLQELVSGRVTVLSEGEFRAMQDAVPAVTVAADLMVFDRVSMVGDRGMVSVPSLHVGGSAPGLVLGKTVGGGRSAMIHWRRDHPLMRFVTPDQVTVSGQQAVLLDADAKQRATVLIDGPSGPLVTLLNDGARNGEGEKPGSGARRVVLSFVLRESTWPQDVSFLVFMTNMVEVLTGSAGAMVGESFTTAEGMTLNIAAGAARTVELKGPRAEAKEVAAGLGEPVVDLRQSQMGQGRMGLGQMGQGQAGLSQTVANQVTVVNFPAAQHVGLYGLRDFGVFAKPVAVNLCNEGETELASRGTGGARGAGREADELAATAQREPRELWKYLLLAAIYILTLEWIVYGVQARGKMV